MSSGTDPLDAAERGQVARAVEVTLDPSPSQERWLRSYVGSMRVAYNWRWPKSATTSMCAVMSSLVVCPRTS